MTTQIMSWPLKRVALARLRGIADGSLPPLPNTTALVSTDARPVDVLHFLTIEPARVCVYGMPVRSVAREITAEMPTEVTQTFTLELRARIFEPGEDREGVDQALGNLCDAVVAALLYPAAPLWAAGRVWLASVVAAPQEVAGAPEPSITAEASLLFSAEGVGYGG